MAWLSTAGRSSAVSLPEALRRGLAPDGGLYLPEKLEPLPGAFFERLAERSLSETSSRLALHLLGRELTAQAVDRIATEALDFPIPLVRVHQRIWALELFHGPTLAFKDVGARFLARLLEHLRLESERSTVLVATSGDTGGAVAQAFSGVDGVRVAVLYPEGQVTPVQERQFTTLGGNIRAFAVEGTFDDCQRMVKQSFFDLDLAERIGLTSANSINIGRLLPQIFYYFHAASQLRSLVGETPILFSTPSGNFGNLTAGLMGKHLGLDCRFVAATNANDIVPKYLETGIYTSRPSLRTLSNAMDVGDPSNLARIRYLYSDNLERLKCDVVGRRVDDETTRKTIHRVDRDFDYLVDPHTAVGFHALEDALAGEDEATVGIVLATAHPAKFGAAVESAVERAIPLPAKLAERLDFPVHSERLPNDAQELRRRLLAWV